MKISKEKHKRMSVVLKKEEMQQNSADKTEGQIFPLKEEEKLQNYVQDRVKDVQRLYKVLGPSAAAKTGKIDRQAMFKKLFVYEGENHPHMAQKPEVLDVK